VLTPELRAQVDTSIWRNLLLQLRPDIFQFSFSSKSDDRYLHLAQRGIADRVGTVATFWDDPEISGLPPQGSERLRGNNAIEADLVLAADLDAKRKLVESFRVSPDRIVVLADRSSMSQSAFDWGVARSRILSVYRRVAKKSAPAASPSRSALRFKLAFVSPLPPEKTGIANYSAVLLHGLSRYYDVTCIVDQASIEEFWNQKNLPVRDLSWFQANGHLFDRFLYQFGNGPTHKHMFYLVQRFPGIVVLHDVFVGHLVDWMESTAYAPNLFKKEIYREAGWAALLADRRNGKDWSKTHFQANGALLENSLGLIVHSKFAAALLRTNPVCDPEQPVRVIPFLPYPPEIPAGAEARRELGFGSDDFVVCSFGWLAPQKRNDLLISAWTNSELSRDPRCRLIFVGEDPANWFTPDIIAAKASRVKKTGYISEEEYAQYLAAADLAVQLRLESRGETSGTIFDCLASGIPVITNAHGANAEFPPGTVLWLPEHCSASDLAEKLTLLYSQPSLRQKLSEQGYNYLRLQHNPAQIAAHYFDSIESIYKQSALQCELELLSKLCREFSISVPAAGDLAQLCLAIAQNRTAVSVEHLLLDLTSISGRVRNSIRRRIGNALMRWMWNRREEFRIEPVRIFQNRMVYARALTADLLRVKARLPDSSVAVNTRGSFVTFDLGVSAISCLSRFTRPFRSHGGRAILCMSGQGFPSQGRSAGQNIDAKEWAKLVATEFDLVCFAAETDAEWLREMLTSLSPEDIPDPKSQVRSVGILAGNTKPTREQQLISWIGYLARELTPSSLLAELTPNKDCLTDPKTQPNYEGQT
jgi:glycosyltransferase involved in cell wall biosynthesis